MARLVRSVPVPWPLLLILVGLTAAAWIQGLRAAAQRHETLQPARSAMLPHAPDPLESERGFVTFDLGEAPPPRVALYQILPERPLIRWIEAAGAPTRRWLTIPLRGLPAGIYAVCAVDPSAEAGPVEMDRPTEELRELGRFEVTARP